jgi:Arc/MetJ-type ribon-helix-helix transcriptional regulator
VQQIVDSKMASGQYESEDDLLRHALQALDAEAEELRAIEAALQEWRSGDPGVPLAAAFDEVRSGHNRPSEP